MGFLQTNLFSLYKFASNKRYFWEDFILQIFPFKRRGHTEKQGKTFENEKAKEFESFPEVNKANLEQSLCDVESEVKK